MFEKSLKMNSKYSKVQRFTILDYFNAFSEILKGFGKKNFETFHNLCKIIPSRGFEKKTQIWLHFTQVDRKPKSYHFIVFPTSCVQFLKVFINENTQNTENRTNDLFSLLYRRDSCIFCFKNTSKMSPMSRK